MSKNKELMFNTLIISIGKICTQFVSFLLIPIYTNYLLTSDYGYIDLIQTYISLLFPLVILRFDASIFRFLIENRNNDKKRNTVLSSSLFMVMMLLLITILIVSLCIKIFSINYGIAIILNLVFYSISFFLLQLTRGLGKNIDYSIGSIISAFVVISANLIFIYGFRYNASSILYSSFLGNLFCSLYLIFKNKLYKYLKIKDVDKKVILDMLSYSLPLIPDELSWWLISASDRTIITAFINTASSGIYAVSSKFGTILTAIINIFNMSWQESASLHVNDDDRDEFFSNILNKTYEIFFWIGMLLITMMPFVFKIFVGVEYQSAYLYMPILFMGCVFNSSSDILGGIYIAQKKTKKVARTSILAAVINLIVNILLVKRIGLFASCISTLVAFVVLTLYRYIDVKKTINIKYNLKMILLSIVILVLVSIIYYKNIFYLNIINLIIVITIITILYGKQIIKIIKNKCRK